MIVVTQPHLRFMVWDGAKYARAPWHRPGVLFHSHAPAASITHGIQVRSDVTYNKADHPDLAEILGVAGSTFVLPDGRARVLRAADNGRGIDAALVNGYLQEDAIRNIAGNAGHSSASFNTSGGFNQEQARFGQPHILMLEQWQAARVLTLSLISMHRAKCRLRVKTALNLLPQPSTSPAKS